MQSGSDIDRAEKLFLGLVRQRRARAGYVLARAALGMPERGNMFSVYALRALSELHDAHKDGELQPPLDDETFGNIEQLLGEVKDEGRSINGPTTVVLLAMALDNAEQK